MLKLFKYLLLTAALLVVPPAGYFLGPFATQTTPDNVEGRIGRICTGLALVRAFESRSRAQGGEWDFRTADCDCLARETVKTLTPQAAAQIVEGVRRTAIGGLTGRAAEGETRGAVYRGLDLLGPALESAFRACRGAAKV